LLGLIVLLVNRRIESVGHITSTARKEHPACEKIVTEGPKWKRDSLVWFTFLFTT